MNILFLDLSTKSTGWAVGCDGNLIDFGCIASASTNIFKRLFTITTSLIRIIEKYNISKIVAEEVRPDIPNNHTFKVLTWLQGIILYEAYIKDNNFEYELIQPSTWRSKIGIKIGAKIKRETLKKESIKYVKEHYSIDANDDVCDAICLMTAYYINDFNWN